VLILLGDILQGTNTQAQLARGNFAPDPDYFGSGSIQVGTATPTESAAVGAVGAMVLAAGRGQFNLDILREVMRSTLSISSMVFFILLGASIFSLTFRGFGGDDMVGEILKDIPGGAFGEMFSVMALMFVMGFFLDFIEIIFIDRADR
jgi:TRAP-type mannitol/chloroaromatic compound transport system permease large subunit